MVEKIIIDKEKCIGCEACIQICPRDCFTLDANSKANFKSTKCHDCGHCISICSEEAISHANFQTVEYESIDNFLDDNFLKSDQMYYLLKSVRSTRQYKKKEIKNEILDKLADIVRYSPTGHHAQNVELVILNSPEKIQQIKDESSIAITSFLKKIDNPFIRFFAKITGKGDSIARARRSRSRFTRMQKGFSEGKDYLFHGAPAIFIFHANEKTTVPAANCNLAAANVRLLAHSYGLGSCYIGYLIYYSKYNKKINVILDIPAENQIYQVLILGYPKYTFKTFVARKPSKITLV